MTAIAEARAAGQREKILQAAAGAIAAHGYHGMSMRRLAQTAGTSLANLYNYFASKEEILFALQCEAFEVLVASARQALSGVEAADARLYVFISHHLRYFAEHPEVMRVLVHEASSLPSGPRRTVRRLKEAYFRLGRDIVAELLAQGCGRPGAAGRETAGEAGVGDEELDRVAYSIFGMLNWIYGWYDPKLHGTPPELARTIHQIALCGVVAHCPYRELQNDLDAHLKTVDSPPLVGPAAPGDRSS